VIRTDFIFLRKPDMSETFTSRDRIKVACLQYCINAGLDEYQMTSVMRSAITKIRSGSVKVGSLAGVAGATLGLGKGIGSLGLAALLAGIPLAGLGAAALANLGGRAVGNTMVGRLPSPDEIKTLDEITAMNRTADEVRSRAHDAEEERRRKAKPSVRRMF
jgi:hypothetical protein